MLELPAAARLVAWGNAVIRDGASPDDALDAISGEDPPHRVVGLPGEPGPVGLALALGRLRADGVRALRLVLPRPGDPTGLPGPTEVNALAVEAGQAVLTVGGPDLVLLPEGRGCWRAHQVRPAPPPAVTLRDASRGLQDVMRETTEELVRLDVARWQPAAAEALAQLSARPGPLPLPTSHPWEALGVLTLAHRLLTIVALAEQSDGAAVSAGEIGLRAGALRDLSVAARRGLEAACSAVPD